MSEQISTFKELEVYQLACALDEKIFVETKSWPGEEKLALVDQIRRSSRSLGANLAEAWAKRRYSRHNTLMRESVSFESALDLRRRLRLT